MKTKAIVLTFLLCLVLPAFAMESRQLVPIPLSMMDQSVDDMYVDCSETMAKKVKEEYFPREMKNELFKNAWKLAESFAKRKYENRKNKALTKEQVQAIYVYSQEHPNVYDPFNEAARGGAAKYSTTAFPYHALHFWLTSAIQVLSENKPCRITYRRTKKVFTGNVNQEMRFGSFASSSKATDLSFGTETCFHIKTCFGAYIKNYSKKGDEREVLIPPYEKFKIIQIAKGSYKDLKDCKTIFVLESTGTMSNLNCKAARNVK